jgi:HlyD family secretion protein
MRRTLIALVIIAVVATGGWFAYQRFLIAPRQAAEQLPQVETVRVERATIASTVNASGNVEPDTETSLAFRAPGQIQAVYVVPGQSVRQGDLLAELDTSDLVLAIAQANVTVEINQAQLAKLVEPPSLGDLVAAQASIDVAQAGVAGAEAALASAQAAYRDLLAGPSEAQRLVNQAEVLQAEATVKTAQQAFDQVRALPNAGALPQSTELERATIALEVARAQAALTDEPPADAEVAAALNQIAQAEVSLRQAQSNLITAQDSLQTLLDGPSEQDIRIAQAQVRQAQLNVLQAEQNLANARLVAPADGIVSQVNARVGEQSATGAPAIILTNLDRLQLVVLVDEIDVRQIALGQAVTVRVDALPNADLIGVVSEIAPTASDVGGVIAYEVTIVPDAGDAPLRAGMSATAIITTAQVDDVLLVPNRYIQLDRESGRAYVYRMVDGAPVLQEVELGLRNERASQVLAGVNEGDEVALVTRSAEEQLRGVFFGGD